MRNSAHIPVMVTEVLAALNPRPCSRYVDATVGWGGHAAAILKASAPDGWLFGCDRDGVAIESAVQLLSEFTGRFELRRLNFTELAGWIEPNSCEGALLDLGVSSPQLDCAERGFSFRHDGPLDMRMDKRQMLTAAELVNTASADELARIFWELGEERQARRLAKAIEQERARQPFGTTARLARLLERLMPRRGKKLHPATRVFQALRMAVNDEIGCLQRGLKASWATLKCGGRLAVITFHSLEARVVKGFGRELGRDYTIEGDNDVPELRRPCIPQLKRVTHKAIRPTAAEVSSNPRARSAELRVFEKL